MCFSGRSASRAASREPPAQKSRAEPTPSPASPQLAEPSLTTLNTVVQWATEAE